MAAYIELHTHSNFSFLEGASHIEELVLAARELGYEALALTDHDGLHGAMEFAQCARAWGLKPITGAEITLLNAQELAALVASDWVGNIRRVSKLQVATMARAAIPPHERRLFVIIVDEFQNYAGEGADTSSIRSFQSEARKYNVGLVAATQFISQLAQEVQTAILGNVGTLVALRCGVFDAHVLQKELGRFTMEDILDLGVGHAIVRMGRAVDSFNLAIEEVKIPQLSYRDEVVALSRERYCRPREEVEASLRSDMPPPAQEIPRLDSDDQRFLEYVAEHPEETVTRVYQALGVGANRGGRIREKLKAAGFVVEVETRLGQGGTVAKFVVPTLAGFKAIDRPAPGGRGGPIHRHFQRLIADHARASGYTARLEHRVPDGSVDVHLEKGGKIVAVEVSVTSTAEREMQNIEKCLKASYDFVLTLFLDDAEMVKLRELLPEEKGQRVIVEKADRLLESFLTLEKSRQT